MTLIENLGLLTSFLLLIAPMTHIVHEMGHIFGALIAKADYIYLSIGKGKKILTLSLGKLIITIHFVFFMGGQTESKREKTYQPIDILVISLAGPLMNLLCVFIFYFMFQFHLTNHLLIFILFNLWIGLGNLIPFKIREQQSDGYLVLKAFFSFF